MYDRGCLMEAAFGAETLISRSRLKSLARRNDRAGLVNLAIHVAALLATGGLIYFAQGTLWIIPAMAAHGVVIAFLFAPMHETSHGTAFRSRWLNELVFRLISLVYISPPVFFRYFHAAHHTYTQIRGKDPDIVMPSPGSFTRYAFYVSSLPFWKRNITWFVQHALGSVSEQDRWYIPEDELPRVYREARIMLMIYASLALGSLATGSTLLLTYWLVPRLMGEPVMRWIRVAEHTGCEESGDLRRNTRTTRAPKWLHLLFWNMSYHAEHHLAPAVPFHALPALHREVGNSLHPLGPSYLAVHREIFGAMKSRNGRDAVTAA
jgi:fatty acid desaturase